MVCFIRWSWSCDSACHLSERENAFVFLFHLFGTSPLEQFYRFIRTTTITNELTILLMKASVLLFLMNHLYCMMYFRCFWKCPIAAWVNKIPADKSSIFHTIRNWLTSNEMNRLTKKFWCQKYTFYSIWNMNPIKWLSNL